MKKYFPQSYRKYNLGCFNTEQQQQKNVIHSLNRLKRKVYYKHIMAHLVR